MIQLNIASATGNHIFALAHNTKGNHNEKRSALGTDVSR